MNYFQGGTVQRGYGLGGVFRGLARSFTPVIKRGLIEVGKRALNTGVDILSDFADGESLKHAAKRRMVNQLKNPISLLKPSQPVSRKRKSTISSHLRKNTRKKRKKDIFDGK